MLVNFNKKTMIQTYLNIFNSIKTTKDSNKQQNKVNMETENPITEFNENYEISLREEVLEEVLEKIETHLLHYEKVFTKTNISECLKKLGYEINPERIAIVAKNIYNINVEERAMFLAQIIHESQGLNEIEELSYKGNKMAPHYGKGCEGKSYHGRGFIQLTWPANYQKLDDYLKMNGQLLENPELVCDNLKYAWKATEFYWKTYVSSHWGVQQKLFWATTFSINGPLECIPFKENDQANARWRIYETVSDFFKEKNKAKKGKDIMDKAIDQENKAKEEENKAKEK